MRTILVTGGAGYVGAVLVPKLLRAGYYVRVLDLFLYGRIFKKNKHLELIKGDIRREKILKDALHGIDSVIHLASISNDPSFQLDPKFGKSVNYDATVTLINLAKKARVKRFIFASSSSVYGIKSEKNVTENLSLKPLTDYSKYKALGEACLLQQASKGFTVVILRPATVCGWSPRLRLDLTVNILTINALVNKKIIVYGGSQKRPNIHIEDMADVYVRMLTYPKEKISGKIFNVGFQNYTIAELANMVKRVLGDRDITVEVHPTNDFRSYHISSDKIKRQLGFVPKHTVEEAILDLAKAYRAGKILRPLTNNPYYNIKTMKKALHKTLQ